MAQALRDRDRERGSGWADRREIVRRAGQKYVLPAGRDRPRLHGLRINCHDAWLGQRDEGNHETGLGVGW